MIASIRRALQRAYRAFAAALVTALLGVALLSGWLDGIDWLALERWAGSRLPALALFAVAVGLAIAGTVKAVRTPGRKRPPGLSWWIVVGAAVIVIAAVTGATGWLLSEADHAVDRGAARVDAIKTGLGVGAGTAGIFALLLAVRRQIHQERTAADTILDATEKRVTELYTKAADQLGSGNAAVRLAGLYALARLGDNHPDQAETVLNVICAYLRMPYGGPSDAAEESSEGPDHHESDLQEAQVRLTAQRILSDHLSETFGGTWRGVVDLTGAHVPGIDLDLTNLIWARLDGATLTRASLRRADLSSASLVGADLSHADLTAADLEAADLTDANFAHANLDDASLDDATLTRADFTGARLPDGLSFRNGMVVKS